MLASDIDEHLTEQIFLIASKLSVISFQTDIAKDVRKKFAQLSLINKTFNNILQTIDKYIDVKIESVMIHDDHWWVSRVLILRIEIIDIFD